MLLFELFLQGHIFTTRNFVIGDFVNNQNICWRSYFLCFHIRTQIITFFWGAIELDGMLIFAILSAAIWNQYNSMVFDIAKKYILTLSSGLQSS